VRALTIPALLMAIGCGPMATYEGDICDTGQCDELAPKADVKLTFKGCTADFGQPKDVVVGLSSKTNGFWIARAGMVSLVVAAEKGKITLSSKQRADSIKAKAPTVLGLMIGKKDMFANNCTSCMGDLTKDTIKGTITVNEFDTKTGKLDALLEGVVLEIATAKGGTTCEISGTIKTVGFSFGTKPLKPDPIKDSDTGDMVDAGTTADGPTKP
jgi:hypothetical protein